MKKSVWYALAIVSMLIFSSCAHVECGKIEKVKNVKTEEAASSINPSEIKGDDPNKLISKEGEESVLIKGYFPQKYILKENEKMEVSLLPGALAEFSFISTWENKYLILIKNDDTVLRRGGFFVDYYGCMIGQPNVFELIGSQKIKKEERYLHEGKEGEILKIVIENDSNHLILPVSILPEKYVEKKTKKIELPNR